MNEQPLIIVEVHGGVVQNVYCSIPNAKAIIVDWDADGCFPGEDGVVEIELRGRTQVASVGEMPLSPLEEMAGTDVGLAIDAARDQGAL